MVPRRYTHYRRGGDRKEGRKEGRRLDNGMILGKNKSTLIPKDIMYSQNRVRACNTHTPYSFRPRPEPDSINPSILQKKIGVTKSNKSHRVGYERR
jgi:hypothetical protein